MCIDFIKRKMTFENASDLLCIGDVFSIESLRPYYRDFVMKNFCDFAQTDIFLKLDVELLVDYLLDNALKVPSEAKLFEFVLRWYNHDPKEREQYAFTVFDKVRYVVHGWPAIHVASRCELFQTNQKCKEILKFCEDYMANAEKRYTFYDHRTRARYNEKTLVQIGGITKWSNTYSEGMSFYPIYHEDMECGWDLNNYYHSDSGIWLPLGCMANLNMMSHSTITEINDFGIVCGGFVYDIESDGFVDHAPTKGVKMFQSSGMSYFELDDLRHARGCHAAAYLPGCLYVIGGKDNRQPLASVEALKNDEGKWKYVKPLPKPLFEHAAAACGGKIYVSGGIENREVTNKVWCYDPALNKWYKRAPMLTARSSHGMVTYKDRLYACGGRRSLSLKSCLTSMEMYVPEENKWKHLTPMRHDAAHVSLVVMNEKILVCGGEDSKNFLIDLIQQYDPEKDEWSIYGTLPRPLRGLACCALTINQDRLSYDDDSDDGSNFSAHAFSLDDFGDSMDDSS
ncbi:hypothetical protein KUTeg_024690 [Tegillarca granosa]|uniref:BACK domain-containing protein n=1 Tax=Tegillarca granosa TaxID=220873 RepID=A0ABQ9DY01_TEGGR|nr:hypothetical protein KUTeg_024690 [Tegillarca granosa]